MTSFPKKRWLSVPDSTTGKAEVPEDDIQSFTDELLQYKRHIRSIRIPDSFFRWIKMNAPAGVQKWFFGVFGGQPDNTLLVQLGDGWVFGLELEHKTQDSKGRAVGRLHGKQKHHQWRIARSTKAAEEWIAELEEMAEQVKWFVADRAAGKEQKHDQ
jgi:hypothetical protein